MGAGAALAPALCAQQLERYHFDRALMGTPFRIVLYAMDSVRARQGAVAAFARVDALERRLSDYDPSSEVSRLSATAGSGEWVSVSKDLWTVLAAAQDWAARTDGAFDVTVGPLTRLWRWAGRRATFPPHERLNRARESVGYRFLLLNPATRSVRLELDGMRLDLGGIGKGYAADAALDVLRSFGVHHALVDAGGDVVLGDAPPGTTGWRVEIPGVEDGRVVSEIRHLARGAVATSGDAYRFIEVDSVRYSHIMDPQSGMGLTERRVVTVLAPTGTEADALASAVSVLGPMKGIAFVDGRPGAAARILQRDVGGGGRWRQWQSSCLERATTKPTGVRTVGRPGGWEIEGSPSRRSPVSGLRGALPTPTSITLART